MSPESQLKWYAVQTYSGSERKVQESLIQRMQQHHLEDHFGEIIVPEKQGEGSDRKKVSMPGYLFVEMRMAEKAWHLVKDTPRVIGFIGNQNPREVPAAEIESMRKGEGTGKPKPRLMFANGEEVRVLEGAFANFTGTVSEVNVDKQKIKVTVSIFGRPTSVELDFATVEKMTETSRGGRSR